LPGSGSRFTYAYALNGDILYYWFGDIGSPIFSRGVISPDGRNIVGRWHMPTKEKPDYGYDYRLTRMD